eukprot:CAMPEP_0180311926 /NCGR_PEP_ID=MMETSP0988-20121125/30535_1 /TAXON_ID=697907 /ORGANISM="non described non described, Strain CCMP2293" /LENGTH=55 /DNA_ID=CAMNT_0022296089 /DNA_START=30 /DNA_END=193 /DNA_ORIENTATION=-
MAFLQTSSGVRQCWELEEPKGPKGRILPGQPENTPCLGARCEGPGARTGPPQAPP